MLEAPTSKLPESLVSMYCEQIDAGGTTIGFDVEHALEHSTFLATRVKKIIELRWEEMQQLAVRKVAYADRIDLRVLWLSAYGFQILSAMGLGLECSEEEFEQVQSALQELGFEMEVREDGPVTYPDNISPQPREYIWKLAKDRKLREKMRL